MNKKKTIIITVIIISIILICSIIGCIIVYNKNMNLKSKKLNLVIYQYYTSPDKLTVEPIIYETLYDFNNETSYDKYIYMLEDDNEYNHIIIKDGKVIVTEANCYNGNCKRMIIDINDSNFSLLNPNITTIECKPHGLKITLEEAK